MSRNLACRLRHRICGYATEVSTGHPRRNAIPIIITFNNILRLLSILFMFRTGLRRGGSRSRATVWAMSYTLYMTLQNVAALQFLLYF